MPAAEAARGQWAGVEEVDAHELRPGDRIRWGDDGLPATVEQVVPASAHGDGHRVHVRRHHGLADSAIPSGRVTRVTG